jgi:hypothetical protein
MFGSLARTITSRLARAAALVRALAVLADGAARAGMPVLPAVGPAAHEAIALHALETAIARQARIPHAHRVPLTPVHRRRRPGAATPRPAVCLTPVAATTRGRRSGVARTSAPQA